MHSFRTLNLILAFLFCCSACATSAPDASAVDSKVDSVPADVEPMPKLDVEFYFNDNEDKASHIRRNFNRDYQKLRREHGKSIAKSRKEFSRVEKKERKVFLDNLKKKRKEFLKAKPERQKTKDFFAEQDALRKDFFADQKDKRKDHESELKQRKKDFDSFAKDTKKEFDERIRAFIKTAKDNRKAKAAGLRSSALQRAPKERLRQKLTDEEKTYIEDFRKIPKGQGVPLKAGSNDKGQ